MMVFFIGDIMIEEKTQIVHTENPPTGPARFLAPLAVGFAVLLVIGGIALGLRNNDDEVANLPDYSPAYVTPSDSSPSGTNVSPSPVASPSPQSTNSSNQVATEQKPKQVAIAKKQPAPSVKGASTTTTASGQTLPDYQPQYALPAYTPQSALPAYTPQFQSPEKQTISVRIVVPGRSYTVAVAPDSSVLEALQAARQSGLTFKTEYYAGMGEKVVEMNGVKEGDSKFWLYDINGAFATKGISATTVQNNDTITWKLS
jgi:hypothetical protein